MVGWLIIGASSPLWEPTRISLESGLCLGFAAAVVGGLVHLISYIVIGLPLFNHVYEYPNSQIWSVGYSAACGITAGTLAFLLLWLLFKGYSPNLEFLLIGAIYGLWTALSARRFRPKREDLVPAGPSSTPIDLQ